MSKPFYLPRSMRLARYLLITSDTIPMLLLADNLGVLLALQAHWSGTPYRHVGNRIYHVVQPTRVTEHHLTIDVKRD